MTDKPDAKTNERPRPYEDQSIANWLEYTKDAFGMPCIRRELVVNAAAELASLRSRIAALKGELVKKEAFKVYTHQRLSELGAPHEVPESEHTKAGCRVGGRFDWVEERLEDTEGELELISSKLAAESAARIQAEKERDEAKGELMLERVNWCQEALKTPEGQALVHSRARVAAACIGEESYTDSTGTIWDRPSAEVFFLTSNALIESNKARDAAKDKLAAAEQELERVRAMPKAEFKVLTIGDFSGEVIRMGKFSKHDNVQHVALVEFPTIPDAQAFAQSLHQVAVALLAQPQGEERGDG